jgi:hypothetical protein
MAEFGEPHKGSPMTNVNELRSKEHNIGSVTAQGFELGFVPARRAGSVIAATCLSGRRETHGDNVPLLNGSNLR